MRAKFICVLLVFSASSHGGVKELTWHSRANCVGFNESITWHLNHSYKLKTYSFHQRTNDGAFHELRDGWRTTWRSAAYHATESYRGGAYMVIGTHWISRNGRPEKLGETVVGNCSIYDGWWDH